MTCFADAVEIRVTGAVGDVRVAIEMIRTNVDAVSFGIVSIETGFVS